MLLPASILWAQGKQQGVIQSNLPQPQIKWKIGEPKEVLKSHHLHEV